jgi:sulfate/thiosulfate transport system ATP-binding protein
MQVDIRNLSKSFGATRVLKDISLDVREGELCALLGPSGSGKTTLLRIIAGLDFPDAGAVLFDGEDVVERSARDRKVGFVFQHYALFRHMTVYDNIAFGLNIRPRATRPTAVEIRRRVSELLELVQLADYGARFPDQLSGGQRQRVALARALAIEPRILLLDEPFGALDARVRKEMRKWLRELQQKIRLTSVFVTHDQDEALELADRVAVMEQGELVQVGSPQEVYDQPSTPFVYDFLGGANRIACRIVGGRVLVGDDLAGHASLADDDAAMLYVRAHDFELLPDGRSGGLRGSIVDIALTGGLARLAIQLAAGEMIEMELPRWATGGALSRGQAVRLQPRLFGVFGPRCGGQSGQLTRVTSAGETVAETTDGGASPSLQRMEAAIR